MTESKKELDIKAKEMTDSTRSEEETKSKDVDTENTQNTVDAAPKGEVLAN